MKGKMYRAVDKLQELESGKSTSRRSLKLHKLQIPKCQELGRLEFDQYRDKMKRSNSCTSRLRDGYVSLTFKLHQQEHWKIILEAMAIYRRKHKVGSDAMALLGMCVDVLDDQ